MLRTPITDLLVLHGERFGGVDPEHTEKGIGQIVSLGPVIKEFHANAVAEGTGIRFVEMRIKFYQIGCIEQTCTIISSEYLGTTNCSMSLGSKGPNQTKLVVVQHGGTSVAGLVHPRCYVGIAQDDPEILNVWNLICRKFPERTVFFCGQPFARMVVAQSATKGVVIASECIYRLNRHQKRVQFLVKGVAPEEQGNSFTRKLEKAVQIIRKA